MSEESNSDDARNLQAQLIELEHNLGFQQRAYDQLNAVVLEQQSQIEELQREIKALRESLEELAQRGGGGDLPHERPPHY